MKTRPVLHEAENEAEAKIYEAEATKFDLTKFRHFSTFLHILTFPGYAPGTIAVG